jgi:hypothetical protein
LGPGDFSSKVQFVISGLESCQNYRVVVTAVTAGGKKSLEMVHVTQTGFEGEHNYLEHFN